VNDKQRFQLTAAEALAGGGEAPLAAAAAPALAPSVDPPTVVLVEGTSDQVALQALAGRRGRDLAAAGIAVVPMGGARNIRRFLERFGPRGLDVSLAGLCDAGAEADFRRALEWAGLGANLSRADMEALGFYVCVADLEDELIRCLGAAAVEQVIEAQGELGSFHTFQQQPAWQGQSSQQQLRRFIGTHSGRKARYARLLVDALELSSVPRPLDRVLAQIRPIQRRPPPWFEPGAAAPLRTLLRPGSPDQGRLPGPRPGRGSVRFARRWSVRRRDIKPAPAPATTMISRLPTMKITIYGWRCATNVEGGSM
jgi:hypothetical protein